MKKTYLKVIFLGLLLIISNSCIKKITGEKTKPGYWNHYLFSSPVLNFATNGIVANGQLVVSVHQAMFVFDDFELYPRRVGALIPISYDLKPALATELSAHRSTWFYDEIAFYRHTEGSYYTRSIIPEQFGDSFKNYRFKQSYGSLREIGTFNSQNRFVTIIADYTQSGMEFNEHIVFVDLDPHSDIGLIISNLGFWEKSLLPLGPYRGLRFSNIFSYNDKFYTAYSSTAYGKHYIEISEDGSIREFIDNTPRNEHIHVFFEFKGYLFAQLDFGQFIFSLDGENWMETQKLDARINDFKDINGYLFFYRNDEIYFIEAINDNLQNLSLYQVGTANIKSRTISSINKFKDDLVITTSHGIFYKNFDVVISETKKNKLNENNKTNNTMVLKGV